MYTAEYPEPPPDPVWFSAFVVGVVAFIAIFLFIL